MKLTAEERAEIQRLRDEQGDGQKFRDPEFPAENKSLSAEGTECVVAWRRPRQLVEKPVLFEDGASSKDVTQGQVGDCWFLSAAAAVAQYPKCIHQVIPEDQHLYGKGHTGILVFRFWRMGEWVSMYIDDRLPVDEEKELYYARCSSDTEFWLPLLEKAFAKFHGNYHNLDAGFLGEGILSLTGSIVVDIPMEGQHVRNVHRTITQELKNKSIITCATNETKSEGLVSAHAYTVTGVGRLRLGDSLVRLVRVRNPHATGEWQGPWADGDPNWDEVDGQKLSELGYENTDDGQFWIQMTHFKKNFPDLTLGIKVPDIDEFRQLYETSNSWEEGLNAGGNLDNKEKFITNPQYTLSIQETDGAENESEEEEEESEEKTSNVVVELIQEHDRSKYEELERIGITIFKVEDPSQRSLSHEDLESLKPYIIPDFINNSSVVSRLALEPGTYIIVPSTEEPDISRKFLVRVYALVPITFLT